MRLVCRKGVLVRRHCGDLEKLPGNRTDTTVTEFDSGRSLTLRAFHRSETALRSKHHLGWSCAKYQASRWTAQERKPAGNACVQCSLCLTFNHYPDLFKTCCTTAPSLSAFGCAERKSSNLPCRGGALNISTTLCLHCCVD